LDRPVFVRSPPRRGETQPGNDASVPPHPFTPTPVGNTSTGMPPITGRPVYPHARGEHVKIGRLPMGTVPFTPTPVGNTFASENGVCFAADHPHARGEHRAGGLPTHQPDRSPPRIRWEQHGKRKNRSSSTRSPPPARGTHSKTTSNQFCWPFTPGCAGNTDGESSEPPRSLRSPPHTRETRFLGDVHCLERPFTPAHAGNTWRAMGSASPATDHPRVRGEHRNEITDESWYYRLPPRTRGTPQQ